MPVTLLLRLRRDVEKRIFSSAVGIMPPPRKTKTSSAKRKPVQNPTRTHVEKKSRQTTSPSDVQPCSLCSFDNLELARVREQLLGWYDEHQRDMPWRHGTYKDGYVNLKSSLRLDSTGSLVFDSRHPLDRERPRPRRLVTTALMPVPTRCGCLK
eukprot:m.367428 g.367428  ORF g.367428 m.367428 type:complete len:154 (+) comp20833_c0_seq3:99-560(+)